MGLFQVVLDGIEELRAGGAIYNSMIAGERQLHALTRHEPSIFNDWHITDRADSENTRVWQD